MYPKIDSPRAGSAHQVPLSDIGIVENICSIRRKSKCVRVPNLIAAPVSKFANYERTVGGLSIEVSIGIERSSPKIAWHRWATVVASPERCESGAGFGEYVEAGLPSAEYCIRDLRK